MAGRQVGMIERRTTENITKTKSRNGKWEESGATGREKKEDRTGDSRQADKTDVLFGLQKGIRINLRQLWLMSEQTGEIKLL